MLNALPPRDIARQARSILTTATLRGAANGRPPHSVDKVLRTLSASTNLYTSTTTRANAFNAIASYLESHDRSEFVYKSLIARKLFLPRHNISRATFTTEFSIGKSLLDVLVANSRLTGYEIKTEKDDPSKLQKQLSDYYRAVSTLWVVISESQTERYQEMVADSPTGLLALTDRLTFKIAKRATPSFETLDIETMMKSLRKPEYMRVVESRGGSFKNIRPVDHFTYALDFATEHFSPLEFNRNFRRELSGRSHPSSPVEALAPFTHSALQLNLNHAQFERAWTWLQEGFT